MVDVEALRGSVSRIKKCAYDLLSIGDEFEWINDDDDRDSSWDLMRRDLRLKSTFLFCDFNNIISASPHQHHKNTLTLLANKLFHSIQELDYAVEIQSISLMHERYNEAAVVLHEVMAFMTSQADPSPPAV